MLPIKSEGGENQVTTSTSQSKIEPLFGNERRSINFETDDIHFDEVSIVHNKLDESEMVEHDKIQGFIIK